MSEVPSALDHFPDGLRRIGRICRDGSLFEGSLPITALDGSRALFGQPLPTRAFQSEQSQRDSKPCRHLESVIRHVQLVRLRTVLAGQDLRGVQAVHSLSRNIGEKMDNKATGPRRGLGGLSSTSRWGEKTPIAAHRPVATASTTRSDSPPCLRDSRLPGSASFGDTAAPLGRSDSSCRVILL